MIEIEDLDPIDESIVLLKGIKIIASNMSAKHLGFLENRELLEIFSCKEMKYIVSNILEGRDFSIESRVYFFEVEAHRDVKITYTSNRSLLFITDLTEIKELREAKKDFVVSVSHELFNPLSVLKGNVCMLLDIEKDEEKRDIIRKIEKSVKRIERIVQQLKIVSMAQLGLYSIRKSPIDPVKVYEEVLNDLYEKIKSKNIRIEFICKTDAIYTDGFAFYIIMKNLVSNAVKYSYPNSTVRVEVSDHHLSVEDHGIGIKDEEKDRIFERFYRGKEAMKMAPGSGLGLSVVKHLCNLLGYKLRFTSSWLIGSKFIVEF